MATALSAFLPYVIPWAPGAPRPTVQAKVLDAITELCEESLLLRETLTAFDLTINIDTYTLTPPAGSDVIMATSVMVNDKPIWPASEDELDTIDVYWRKGIVGLPNRWFQPSPTTLRFNRIPDRTLTGGVLVEVATKPTLASTTVDDELYTEWREHVANGALWRLLSMRGVEWEDQKIAQEKGIFWNSAIARAKARARMGKTRAPTFAKMRTV